MHSLRGLQEQICVEHSQLLRDNRLEDEESALHHVLFDNLLGVMRDRAQVHRYLWDRINKKMRKLRKKHKKCQKKS